MISWFELVTLADLFQVCATDLCRQQCTVELRREWWQCDFVRMTVYQSRRHIHSHLGAAEQATARIRRRRDILELYW